MDGKYTGIIKYRSPNELKYQDVRMNVYIQKLSFQKGIGKIEIYSNKKGKGEPQVINFISNHAIRTTIVDGKPKLFESASITSCEDGFVPKEGNSSLGGVNITQSEAGISFEFDSFSFKGICHKTNLDDEIHYILKDFHLYYLSTYLQDGELFLGSNSKVTRYKSKVDIKAHVTNLSDFYGKTELYATYHLKDFRTDIETLPLANFQYQLSNVAEPRIMTQLESYDYIFHQFDFFPNLEKIHLLYDKTGHKHFEVFINRTNKGVKLNIAKSPELIQLIAEKDTREAEAAKKAREDYISIVTRPESLQNARQCLTNFIPKNRQSRIMQTSTILPTSMKISGST
ncbi:MAG: hypothetical protein R3B93_20405 [Bacteroidia bacterium]